MHHTDRAKPHQLQGTALFIDVPGTLLLEPNGMESTVAYVHDSPVEPYKGGYYLPVIVDTLNAYKRFLGFDLILFGCDEPFPGLDADQVYAESYTRGVDLGYPEDKICIVCNIKTYLACKEERVRFAIPSAIYGLSIGNIDDIVGKLS